MNHKIRIILCCMLALVEVPVLFHFVRKALPWQPDHHRQHWLRRKHGLETQAAHQPIHAMYLLRPYVCNLEESHVACPCVLGRMEFISVRIISRSTCMSLTLALFFPGHAKAFLYANSYSILPPPEMRILTYACVKGHNEPAAGMYRLS
jgi:hypothetical protein